MSYLLLIKPIVSMWSVGFERWKTIVSKPNINGSVANDRPYHGFMDSIERRHMDVEGSIFGFGILLIELVSGMAL